MAVKIQDSLFIHHPALGYRGGSPRLREEWRQSPGPWEPRGDQGCPYTWCLASSYLWPLSPSAPLLPVLEVSVYI